MSWGTLGSLLSKLTPWRNTAAKKRRQSRRESRREARWEKKAPQRRRDSLVASYNCINHQKRKRLCEMKVFVLDNSLRESTVGQIVGHSLEDKFKVLDEVSKCGFHDQIVGAFAQHRRVDDAFCLALGERDTGTRFYAFTEDSDNTVNGEMLFGPDHIPIALKKMKEYKIPSAIIEVDLADDSVDWEGKFPVSKFMEMITFLLEWTHANLVEPGVAPPRNMFNIRDLPIAMLKCPERTLDIVAALARLPDDIRPDALIFEEPVGEYFADEVAGWTSLIRATMDDNGWTSQWQESGKPDGMLLVHVHRQWGLADAAVLDVLAAGGDGIWCSIAEEGAAMGHACSAVTLANLARLGNKDVVTRYSTKNLAPAARAVTLAVTNKPVDARQLVYGPRAIEAVFGFSGIAGGTRDPLFDFDGNGVIDEIDHFTLAEFLGVEDPPIRITSLVSPGLFVQRLNQCFGKDPLFTEEAGEKLLMRLEQELELNIEREHTSPVGLAILWDEAFGSFTPEMRKVVEEREQHLEVQEKLLGEAETVFRHYIQQGDNKGLSLEFSSFYAAYLQPFIGCFACPRTRFVIDAIDLDKDGCVQWEEWRCWCLWALREHPSEISNVDDLHSVVLRQAILPLSLSQATKSAEGVVPLRMSQAPIRISQAKRVGWRRCSEFASKELERVQEILRNKRMSRRL